MQPVKTVTPSTIEKEALGVLLSSRTPGVPVVDEEGLLVGFVTDGHLLASALPDYLKVMNDVSFVSEAGDKWLEAALWLRYRRLIHRIRCAARRHQRFRACITSGAN